MRAGQAKLPKGGFVRPQLAGRQQFRREALFPEQLAHQPECRTLVALALNQPIKTKGMVLDVYSPDGKKYLGDIPITKTGLTWCNGKKPTGPKASWQEFIDG
jgi:hypothetical protein